MQSEIEAISIEKDREETSTTANACSFANYIDQSTITPFKIFLQENIKSFNLLPNEENSTTENELEKSLKAKYNFDTPILEIILKVTSDYDLIQDKLKEYLDLFGEINAINYDHNANTLKINYKYYFSCLYANRSLINILQKQIVANSTINYYLSCNCSNKSINSAISKDKPLNEKNDDKNFSQAFKFLTENYKANNKFKTQIIKKKENDEINSQNIIETETSKNKINVENETSNRNRQVFIPKLNQFSEKENSNLNSVKNNRTKYRWSYSNKSYYDIRKKLNNRLINPLNNALLNPELFYAYLSMNNPNAVKIPVPIPVPVPVPVATPNKNMLYSLNNKENYNSLYKTHFNSSCVNQNKSKERIPISLIKTKMKTESINDTDSPQSNSKNNINNNINNFYEGLLSNSNNKLLKEIPKNGNTIKKEKQDGDYENKQSSISSANEEKEELSVKDNISSNSNISGKSPQDIEPKNGAVNSIKSDEKNKNDYLISTMDQKRLSLDRLNYYLQNNKPISNFNNPIKNLSSDENEAIIRPNNLPLPFLFPIPLQFPFNFPKFKANRHQNQYLFQGFDKSIIDFDKLTLNTKNTIKFDTYSSRDYYYKYVCNYLVQIENDDNFLITKRIIGKNGCFLKKIIQESCIKYGDFSTKIRLRGKGSGYLEQNGKESEEPLMLCISSLNYPTYVNCCQLIESLLKKVYNDYYEYLLKILPKELHYSINIKRILKYDFVVNRFASGFPRNNKSNNKSEKRLKEEILNQENECDVKN